MSILSSKKRAAVLVLGPVLVVAVTVGGMRGITEGAVRLAPVLLGDSDSPVRADFQAAQKILTRSDTASAIAEIGKLQSGTFVMDQCFTYKTAQTTTVFDGDVRTVKTVDAFDRSATLNCLAAHTTDRVVAMSQAYLNGSEGERWGLTAALFGVSLFPVVAVMRPRRRALGLEPSQG